MRSTSEALQARIDSPRNLGRSLATNKPQLQESGRGCVSGWSILMETAPG